MYNKNGINLSISQSFFKYKYNYRVWRYLHSCKIGSTVKRSMPLWQPNVIGRRRQA